MSRLYVQGNTDVVQEIKARANETVRLEVLWGHKEDPRLACEVRVHWPAGFSQPCVAVIRGEHAFFMVKGEYDDVH